MVAVNKILLAKCTGEGCGGGTRNPPREARLHACPPFHFLLSPFCRRSRPARDPIGYRGGINLYGYGNSSPVGNVDAEGMQRFTSTPVQPAPPPGSAGALLQQYSGRNSKNYPSNLPPPYDGAGGVPLGPLLAGGWRFTGRTGWRKEGYTDFTTWCRDGKIVVLAHHVYVPIAQIWRGGGGSGWATDIVSGVVGTAVGTAVATGLAASTAPETVGATLPASAIIGIATGIAVAKAMQGEPYQVEWVRIYGPERVGQRWVEP